MDPAAAIAARLSPPSFPVLPSRLRNKFSSDVGASCIEAIRRAGHLASSLGFSRPVPFLRLADRCLVFAGDEETSPTMHAPDMSSVPAEAHLVDVTHAAHNCNLALYPSAAGAVEWTRDSGAALDLVSRQYVSSSSLAEHRCARPVQLQTAAGPLTVDTVAPMIVRELSLPIQPLVLADSPAWQTLS